MNTAALIKKTLLVLILACSFSALSANAYYVWNRHYTRCHNGYCTHFQSHKVCNNGHCWYHWSRHNW